MGHGTYAGTQPSLALLALQAGFMNTHDEETRMYFEGVGMCTAF
jgi:hypothetical protein